MTTPTQSNESLPSAPNELEIEKLKYAVAKLQADASCKKKDSWDKAGILSQFLSGFVIAALGIAVTILVHREDSKQKATEIELNHRQYLNQQSLLSQENAAGFNLSKQESDAQISLSTAHDKAEFDLENRKNYFDYLGRISDATDPQKRALLLSQMEGTLTPDEAAQTAITYLHPPFALGDRATYEYNKVVYESALQVATEFKRYDLGQLEHITQSHSIPDSEIARAILGQRTEVLVRVSEIDDFGDITLNGKPLAARGASPDS